MKTIIIGGIAGGLSAASQIKREDHIAQVIVLEKSGDVSYAACGMPYTRRERTVMPLEWIVNEVNTTVRGWTGYFHYRNCSRILVSVKRHVEHRLITHLRKRHQVKGWKAGYARFRDKLYIKYGLYKMPMTAGWKKAHA